MQAPVSTSPGWQSPCPHKPWMAKPPDRHVPTACLGPVSHYYQATQQSISGRILHINLQGANARQRHACSSNRFAADGMPDGRLLVCGRWHARRHAAGLRPMACQSAACCHYGRELSGGRPGLQIEWSQNIKAVAPESVTAFESIMDGILTRGVTDLLRKTVPVKLPADVALRQCRLCSLRYQD